MRVTCQTRIRLSVYPANNVCPSADQAREMQFGGFALLPKEMTSGFKSSTTDLDSKSQILMLGPVAAHSQYRLGLKHRELIITGIPSVGRVYKCLPSLRSQSIAMPSLPPEAHREPSGETVTVLRNPW